MGSDTKTLILLGTSTVSLFLMLLFNALSGSGTGGDLFVASNSDASNKYDTFITPAGNVEILRKYLMIHALFQFQIFRLGFHNLDSNFLTVSCCSSFCFYYFFSS